VAPPLPRSGGRRPAQQLDHLDHPAVLCMSGN
jgi:hypothetical protein